MLQRQLSHLNGRKLNHLDIRLSDIYKILLPILQKTHCVSNTKNNRLMLFSWIITVDCENYMQNVLLVLKHMAQDKFQQTSFENRF
jgi:hypothetical protein